MTSDICIFNGVPGPTRGQTMRDDGDGGHRGDGSSNKGEDHLQLLRVQHITWQNRLNLTL